MFSIKSRTAKVEPLRQKSQESSKNNASKKRFMFSIKTRTAKVEPLRQKSQESSKSNTSKKRSIQEKLALYFAALRRARNRGLLRLYLRFDSDPTLYINNIFRPVLQWHNDAKIIYDEQKQQKSKKPNFKSMLSKTTKTEKPKTEKEFVRSYVKSKLMEQVPLYDERGKQAYIKGGMLALELVLYGERSPESMEEVITKAFYTENETNIKDLLEEGNIRTNVFSNLGIDDIIKHREHTDDLLMQLNDPSSTAFQELLNRLSKQYLRNENDILTFQKDMQLLRPVPIRDKNGNITSEMKFNLNTSTQSGENVLFYIIRILERHDYGKFTYLKNIILRCIEQNADPHIPVRYGKDNVLSAFSLLLLMFCDSVTTFIINSSNVIERKRSADLWEILELIIKKHRLNSYTPPKYLPVSLEGERIYGYVNYKKITDILSNISSIRFSAKHFNTNGQYMLLDRLLLAIYCEPKHYKFLVDHGLDTYDILDDISNVIESCKASSSGWYSPHIKERAEAAWINWEVFLRENDIKGGKPKQKKNPAKTTKTNVATKTKRKRVTKMEGKK
jgi:hypothetical protein